MLHQRLRGVFTALVTPMNGDGSIDFGALESLIDWQLESGIDGLVPCGTTGESATLTTDERAQVIGHVITHVAGRVPVIAGTGSLSTQVALEHQKRAKDMGAECSLVVTPYYNKPSEEGLYRHYMTLADGVDLPIMLYNVPARTGCDLKPFTVNRLAKHQAIIGIKEATANLDRVSAIRSECGDNFVIFSGDDATALPLILIGGDGVISVTSNIAPGQMAALVSAALSGDLVTASAKHRALRPLYEALFYEANPIPVKAALAITKRIQEHYRLPLCPLSSHLRQELEQVLTNNTWY